MLFLPPGSVRTLTLHKVAPATDLLNSLIVHSDGAPGDVITKLTSRSSSSPLHVVEMLERDESNGENGGGHPWTIESGITSVLLLFNHDPKENDFNVRFGAPKGPWMKIYKLAPMETRAININELIASQEKDDEGHTLPLGVRSGEVGWQSDSTEVGGRVLQASPARAMARNFSRGNYVSQCAVYISPYTSLNLGYGNNGDLGSITPTWDVFGLHPPTSCSCSGGSPTSSQLSVSYSWSSGNSSIANITSGASSALSAWHAAGVGSTTGSYQSYQSTYGIRCAGQAPAQVNPSVQVSSVSASPATINASGNGTITVEAAIGGVVGANHNFTMVVSTYSSNPSNSNLTYQQSTQAATVTPSTKSPMNFTVPFSSNGTAGTVTVQAVLQTTDSGLTVVPPNPVGDSRATITVSP